MIRPVSAVSLLLLTTALLPGCFWGDVEAGVTFTVTEKNVDQYLGLLYPTARQQQWADIFADRPNLCPDGEDECDQDDLARSDELELFMRYDTSRTRGLMTQKGDLQITSHLDVGEVYKALSKDGYDDWNYLTSGDRLHGNAGDGCLNDQEGADRTGVGRCVFEEVQTNEAVYKRLGEDIRLVILINLPGEDDVRSVQCQEAPREFASSDWEYPRSLLVNYDATGPVELDSDETVYGTDDDAPLQQCEVEVYSRIAVATQVFAGDYFGETDEANERSIEDARRITDEPLVGTVVLDELSLPGEDGQAHARGRYNLSFTSQRFSERDGKVTIEGSFDVDVRTDPEEVDDPDREIDLSPDGNEDI